MVFVLFSTSKQRASVSLKFLSRKTLRKQVFVPFEQMNKNSVVLERGGGGRERGESNKGAKQKE